MKSKLLLLTALLILTGCKSEVDKCVDALVKAAGEYKDKSTEYRGRIACLKAQAGKD